MDCDLNRVSVVDNSEQLAVSLDLDLIAARGKLAKPREKGDSEEKGSKVN